MAYTPGKSLYNAVKGKPLDRREFFTAAAEGIGGLAALVNGLSSLAPRPVHAQSEALAATNPGQPYEAKVRGDFGDGKNFTVQYLDQYGSPFLQVTSRFKEQAPRGKFDADVYDLLITNLSSQDIVFQAGYVTSSKDLAAPIVKDRRKIRKRLGTDTLAPGESVSRSGSWVGSEKGTSRMFNRIYQIKVGNNFINIDIPYEYRM